MFTVLFFTVCRPFLPPENGYYVNDIQQIYYANSSIQVACKPGYVLANAYGDPTNGTSTCQPNGLWSQQFYCYGRTECIYTLISDILDFCLQNLSNFNMDLKDLLEEYMFKFEIHNTQFVIEIGI